MITVCFLPSAEHFYATRAISPSIIEVPSPLPIAMKDGSPGACIYFMDNFLIHTNIPTGSLDTPDTDTLLQENIIDIGLLKGTSIIDIGL